MSAIRVSVPGQPTRLIDLGPSVARFHGSAAWGTRNAAVIGTMTPVLNGRANFTESIETAERRRARNREVNAAYRQREREREPRCGKVMRHLQEPCARYAGHSHECRSGFALANAASRRAGVEA